MVRGGEVDLHEGGEDDEVANEGKAQGTRFGWLGRVPDPEREQVQWMVRWIVETMLGALLLAVLVYAVTTAIMCR